MFGIKITQFINPHLFYYQHEEDELLPKPYENYLRTELPSREFFLKSNKGYEPRIHEVVAHYNIIEDKWIRAQVDYITYTIDGKKIFFLFALDYGYSLESIGKWLWPLPQSMHEESKIIFKGGIADIVPCEWKINPLTARQEYMMTKNWNNGPIHRLSQMIDSSHAISFSPDIRMLNGQLFGKLTFKSLSLEVEDAGSVLTKEELALHSNNFLNDLLKCHTRNFQRWQNNDRNSVSFALTTLSPFLKNMAIAPMYKEDGKEDSILMMLEDTTHISKREKKLLRQELENMHRETEQKVNYWRQKNDEYFSENPLPMVSDTQQKIDEVLEMMSEFSIEPRNKPPEVKISKYFSVNQDEKEELRVDKPKPKKIDINALNREVPISIIQPSRRALTAPKPAGFIFNPQMD